MKTSTSTSTSLAFLLLPCLLLTACPLDDDPGFDDWCGDRLCHWNLEEGTIQKTPTWHERDSGVELVGSTVALTQVLDTRSVSCLELKVIADIDPAAAVYLEMDFGNDGVVEYRERIPSANWQPLTFLVSAPTWYEGLTFTIRKESDGRAVLARLEAGDGQGCTGAHIPLDHRPAGASCESPQQCTSGACAPSRICSQTFAACDAETPCADGTGPCVDWPATCR